MIKNGIKSNSGNMLKKSCITALVSFLIPFSVSANELASVAYQNVSLSSSNSLSPKLGVDDLCHKIARKLGSVTLSDCLGSNFSESGGVSVEGSPILVKEYPPLASRKPKSRVLVLGGIHGDEYSSVSIVFKWMKTLDRYHSGMFHWKVVPLVNPDGLLRKKSQRMNSRGVDLNRNFPTPNWEDKSNYYWVTKTRKNPRRYPGPEPLSEPESQWLANYIDEFKPDVIVSIHAPYGILDFDGPNHPPKKLGHLHLNVLGTYPGSLGNYAGIQKEIPVVTIELPYAGIMPTGRQIRNIWVDLVQWLKREADQPVKVSPTQQVQNKDVIQTSDNAS